MLFFFNREVERENVEINKLYIRFEHWFNIIKAKSKIKETDKLPEEYTYEDMINTLITAHNCNFNEAENKKRYDYSLVMCLKAVESAQQITQMDSK